MSNSIKSSLSKKKTAVNRGDAPLTPREKILVDAVLNGALDIVQHTETDAEILAKATGLKVRFDFLTDFVALVHEWPALAVYLSGKQIYAQTVEDSEGSVSSEIVFVDLGRIEFLFLNDFDTSGTA